jgi:hypothetical protein
MNKILPLLFLFWGSQGIVRAQSAQADKKAEKQALANLVESQHYTFVALTVMPMGSGTHELNPGDYDLKVTKESIICYLPYFGVGYSAPADPTKAGIQLTSREFDYVVSVKKRGGWNILMKPKDNRDVQRLSLSISDNGYATLQVVSTERQPISYYGAISVSAPPK